MGCVATPLGLHSSYPWYYRNGTHHREYPHGGSIPKPKPELGGSAFTRCVSVPLDAWLGLAKFVEIKIPPLRFCKGGAFMLPCARQGLGVNR